MPGFLVPLTLSLLPVTAGGPPIQASAALIMDAQTGQVLWERNSRSTRYPASTTKILTSLILLEERSLNDKITAPADTKTVTGSSLHLEPGERITVQTALYSLLLRSANDVCHAIAVDIAGSDAAFAEKMNAKAREIGATRSHFTNPHGLPDPNHTTTALDLALIAREAMKNEAFRAAAATRKTTIDRSLNSKDTILISRNKWLEKDPTADGIKTGFTNDAGQCYVGSATRGGHQVITVVLNTPDWVADHSQMLDWTYGNFEFQQTLNANLKIPVENGVRPIVSAKVSGGPTLTLPKSGAALPRWEAAAVLAPVDPAKPLGTVVFRDAVGQAWELPVVPTEAVPERPRPIFTARRDPAGLITLVGIAMLGGALWMRRRSRRNFF